MSGVLCQKTFVAEITNNTKLVITELRAMVHAAMDRTGKDFDNRPLITFNTNKTKDRRIRSTRSYNILIYYIPAYLRKEENLVQLASELGANLHHHMHLMTWKEPPETADWEWGKEYQLRLRGKPKEKKPAVEVREERAKRRVESLKSQLSRLEKRKLSLQKSLKKAEAKVKYYEKRHKKVEKEMDFKDRLKEKVQKRGDYLTINEGLSVIDSEANE